MCKQLSIDRRSGLHSLLLLTLLIEFLEGPKRDGTPKTRQFRLGQIVEQQVDRCQTAETKVAKSITI